MTITEAMRLVNNEYNEESLRAQNDKAFDALIKSCLETEYEEIDQELPGYVHDIAVAFRVPAGTLLPPFVYQMARMCFRMGMRTQRKLERPEEKTSTFWRSDGRPE